MNRLRLMDKELREHWVAYRKALSGFEPVAFAWTSIGHRITMVGESLLNYCGYEPGDFCPAVLALAGTVTYAGRRGKRWRRNYRSCKQKLVPQSAIPEIGDMDSFGLERPKPKRVFRKKTRAVARGTVVYLKHKNRLIWYKDCITDLGANTAAARINGRNLPVVKLRRTFKRETCPHCGKSVAVNWLKRHMDRYHGET